MKRKILTLAAACMLLLGTAGCTFDYYFVAFVIEGIYPPGDWVEVKCIRYINSGFEIYAGEYEFSMQVDPPNNEKLPRKLQFWLRFFDEDGNQIHSLKDKPRKFRDRRIEGTLDVANDLIFDPGVEVCVWVKTRGKRQLLEGFDMGVDFGRVEEPV